MPIDETVQSILNRSSIMSRVAREESEELTQSLTEKNTNASQTLESKTKEFEHQKAVDHHNNFQELHKITKEQYEKIYSLRVKYARHLFRLIISWLSFVILSIFIKGFCSTFNLSDTVLITFITSTTISVLGLFALAAKWVFNIKQEIPQDQKSS